MAYASALLRSAEATYRQVDLAGRTAVADGPALVQLLYEELLAALGAAAVATETKRYAIKSERVTRATAILFALEAGLDFSTGAGLSETLARLYAGARRQLVDAALGHDPRPFRHLAAELGEIAQAWRTARAA